MNSKARSLSSPRDPVTCGHRFISPSVTSKSKNLGDDERKLTLRRTWICSPSSAMLQKNFSRTSSYFIPRPSSISGNARSFTLQSCSPPRPSMRLIPAEVQTCKDESLGELVGSPPGSLIRLICREALKLPIAAHMQHSSTTPTTFRTNTAVLLEMKMPIGFVSIVEVVAKPPRGLWG